MNVLPVASVVIALAVALLAGLWTRAKEHDDARVRAARNAFKWTQHMVDEERAYQAKRAGEAAWRDHRSVVVAQRRRESAEQERDELVRGWAA